MDDLIEEDVAAAPPAKPKPSPCGACELDTLDLKCTNGKRATVVVKGTAFAAWNTKERKYKYADLDLDDLQREDITVVAVDNSASGGDIELKGILFQQYADVNELQAPFTQVDVNKITKKLNLYAAPLTASVDGRLMEWPQPPPGRRQAATKEPAAPPPVEAAAPLQQQQQRAAPATSAGPRAKKPRPAESGAKEQLSDRPDVAPPGAWFVDDAAREMLIGLLFRRTWPPA